MSRDMRDLSPGTYVLNPDTTLSARAATTRAAHPDPPPPSLPLFPAFYRSLSIPINSSAQLCERLGPRASKCPYLRVSEPVQAGYQQIRSARRGAYGIHRTRISSGTQTR